MAAIFNQSPSGEVTDARKEGAEAGASTSDTLDKGVDVLVASVKAGAWTGRLAEEVGEEMSGSWILWLYLEDILEEVTEDVEEG